MPRTFTRGFVGVFAILGVICLFVAATILFNTVLIKKENKTEATPSGIPVDANISDQTANWKTYIHPAVPYTFKYPSTWNVETTGSTTGSLNVLVGPYINNPKYEFPSMLSIQVYDNRKNLSLLDFVKQNISNVSNANANQKIIVDGISGIKTPLGGATINDNVILQKGSNVYLIRLDHATRPEADISEETFDQILSTFQFTN